MAEFYYGIIELVATLLERLGFRKVGKFLRVGSVVLGLVIMAIVTGLFFGGSALLLWILGQLASILR